MGRVLTFPPAAASRQRTVKREDRVLNDRATPALMLTDCFLLFLLPLINMLTQETKDPVRHLG